MIKLIYSKAAILILVSQFAISQTLYNQKLENIKQDVARKNDDAAISQLRKVLTLTISDLERAKAENTLGWLLFGNGAIQEAKQHLLVAFELAKKSNDNNLTIITANNLGLVYFTIGDTDNAGKFFSIAKAKGSKLSESYLRANEDKIRRNAAIAHLSNGVNYRSNRDFSSAISEYEKAIKIDPNNEAALEYNGYALFRKGNYDESLKNSMHAYELDKTKVNVVINIIKAYCAKSDFNSAKTFADQNTYVINNNKSRFNLDNELKKTCKGLLKY